MQVDLTMPTLGYDMTEGTISLWLKGVGDMVQRGEAIAEIDTDKATVEMESTVTGTIVELAEPQGARVAVGVVIAIIDDGTSK